MGHLHRVRLANIRRLLLWTPMGLGGGGVSRECVPMHVVRLGYCFTPYQRLWLYNGAPLVAFYDTLGIRRMYSRLKPPASSRGSMHVVKGD